MCAQISVFIIQTVLRCRFACHSCSQEQTLTVENTQNYDVEGFFCRHPTVFEFAVINQQLRNICSFNNCGSAVKGESICLENKGRKLFYVVYITQNPKILG